MTIRLINTETLSKEEMAPYWPMVQDCLEKYCAKLGDESYINIIKACSTGQRQLWLVLDENDQVILTPVTEIREETATGIKSLTLAQVGGRRLAECMPLLKDIEQWAKDRHGAVESSLIGRCSKNGKSGWARHLEPLGYSPKAVVFRKRIGDVEEINTKN